MRILSDRILCGEAVWLLCLLIFVGAPCFCYEARADSNINIYKKNRDRIHKKKLLLVDGQVFSFARAKTKTPSTRSRIGAIERARVNAEGQLSEWPLRCIDWPGNLAKHIQQHMASQFLRIAPLEVQTKSLFEVDSGCSGQICYSVVSVPESAIEAPRLSYPHIRKVLRDAFYRKDSRLSMGAYLEFCEDSEMCGAASSLAQRLGDQYGEAVETVINNKDIVSPGKLWIQGKRLPFEKLSELDTDSLFQLLNLIPYDPAVLFALGKSVEKKYPRMAQLLFARGTVWKIDPGLNQRCFNKNDDGSFRDQFREEDAKINKLRDAVQKRYAVICDFSSGIAEFVLKSMGTLPLATLNKSNYAGRTKVIVPDAELLQNPTAENFAVLAERYLARNEPLIAYPFVLQAVRMSNKKENLILLEKIEQTIDI